MITSRSLLLLVLSLLWPNTAQAFEQRCASADAAAAWQEQARRFLLERTADSRLAPVSSATLARQSVRALCIRKNNYWCQKQIGTDFWQGSEGSGGCVGNRDDRNHAIFRSAAWGARAGAQAIRSSFKRGADTALEIASARSPACDTLGSPALWPRPPAAPRIARSCSDNPRPPRSWRGSFCPSTIPAANQCVAGCNCPPRLALAVLRPFPGLGLQDRLPLFDADCLPLPGLVPYLQRQAETEIGLVPNEEVIRAGLNLMSPVPAGSCRPR